MKLLIRTQCFAVAAALGGYAIACMCGARPIMALIAALLPIFAVVGISAKPTQLWAVTATAFVAWLNGAYGLTGHNVTTDVVLIMAAVSAAIVAIFFAPIMKSDLKLGYLWVLASLLLEGAAIGCSFGFDSPLPTLAGLAALYGLYRLHAAAAKTAGSDADG
ncbi:MAG: hypothetical protein WCT10_01570 [Patescibacteria group bacterium]